MTGPRGAGRAGAPAARPLPPLGVLCPASIASVIGGGIYLAAHLPRQAPFAPAVALLAVAAALLLGGLAALLRVREFAWRTFRMVTGWAALAYLAVGGMLEFVFVLDGTRGAMLVLVTLMLIVFVANIPLLLAFTVARYQPPGR